MIDRHRKLLVTQDRVEGDGQDGAIDLVRDLLVVHSQVPARRATMGATDSIEGIERGPGSKWT